MARRTLTFAKSWLFNVNQIFKTTGVTNTDFRQLMLGIKNSMKTFASNPWTVVGSSDSSTSNLSGTDLWAANTNLVWANSNGSAHSWIVLKNLNGLGSFQLLISLLGSSTAGSNWRLAFSPGGNYIGGSASNDPTATDEVVVASSVAWTDSSLGSRVRTALHAIQSSDGQCTRIFHCTQQGQINGIFMIEKLMDSNLPLPYAVLSLGGSTHQLSFSALVTSTANWKSGISVNGTVITLSGSGTAEGFTTAPVANNTSQGTNFANDSDDAWGLFPMGLVSATRGGDGTLGSFQDMYIVSSQLALGSFLETNKKALNLNPLVVPWSSGVDAVVGG